MCVTLYIYTSFNTFGCVCIATFPGIEKWTHNIESLVIDWCMCCDDFSKVITPIQRHASYVQGHSSRPVNLWCQSCWFWPRQGCCCAACRGTKRQAQAYTYWGLCWLACWSEGLCHWEPGALSIPINAYCVVNIHYLWIFQYKEMMAILVESDINWSFG